jgi:hypothetical protein
MQLPRGLKASSLWRKWLNRQDSNTGLRTGSFSFGDLKQGSFRGFPTWKFAVRGVRPELPVFGKVSAYLPRADIERHPHVRGREPMDRKEFEPA